VLNPTVMSRSLHACTMASRSGASSGSPSPCSVTSVTSGFSASRASNVDSGMLPVTRLTGGRYRTRHIRHRRLQAAVTSTCSGAGRGGGSASANAGGETAETSVAVTPRHYPGRTTPNQWSADGPAVLRSFGRLFGPQTTSEHGRGRA
jgi:hypothetical protein